MKNEILKLWRAKQLRVNFFIGLLMSFMMIALIYLNPSSTDIFFRVMFFFFIETSVVSVCYMKFMGLEANYIALLSTHPFSMMQLFENKWRTAFVLVLLPSLLLLPLLIKGLVEWYEIVAVFIYVMSFVVLGHYGALFFVSKMRYDHVSLTMNYEEKALWYSNILQMICLFFLLLLVGLLGIEKSCFLISIMGILGILLRKKYFRFLCNQFKARYYVLIEKWMC